MVDVRRSATITPLSGMDAAFLYLETPVNPLHVCSLILCKPDSANEGRFSYEGLVQHFAERTRAMPVFRQRLVEMPFRLYYPVWIDDPYFDLVHHVRHYPCPAPGGMRELGAVVGRLMQGTMDRRYPLWDVTLIDGLSGGQVAIVGRIHHSVVDGMAGAGVLASLLDFEANPSAQKGQQKVDNMSINAEGPVSEIPSDWDLLKFAARHVLSQPQRVRDLTERTVSRFRSVARRGARQVESPSQGSGLFAPMTYLNRHVGPRRNVAFAQLPLADIKRVRKATGAKLNDVVLAILGGALRHHLQQRNDLPEKGMVAAVPMSAHDTLGHNAGSNQVTFMRAPLGTEIDDPAARIRSIHAATKAGKRDMDTLGKNLLQDWAEIISPQAYQVGVRLYNAKHFDVAMMHNVIFSNVPGPSFPLYMAGSKVEAMYPLGPVYEGCGLNITLFSYCDTVYFGLLVDADMIPDVWDIATAIEKSFAEMCRTVLDSAKLDNIEAGPTLAQAPGASRKRTSRSRQTTKSGAGKPRQ